MDERQTVEENKGNMARRGREVMERDVVEKGRKGRTKKTRW